MPSPLSLAGALSSLYEPPDDCRMPLHPCPEYREEQDVGLANVVTAQLNGEADDQLKLGLSEQEATRLHRELACARFIEFVQAALATLEVSPAHLTS